MDLVFTTPPRPAASAPVPIPNAPPRQVFRRPIAVRLLENDINNFRDDIIAMGGVDGATQTPHVLTWCESILKDYMRNPATRPNSDMWVALGACMERITLMRNGVLAPCDPFVPLDAFFT